MRVRVFLLLFFIATSAAASNRGFRITFRFLPNGANSSENWISIPYLYTPADFGTIGIVDAEDVCRDLGGAATVQSVLRWDEPSSTFLSWTCGSAGTPFAITKGTAYGIQSAPGQVIEGSLVGAHDNNFSFTLASTTGSNLSWISIPYHHKILDVAPPAGIDAEDLCRFFASPAAILRRDPLAGAYVAYACGSTLDTPFPIVIGTGYAIVNQPGQTIVGRVPYWAAQ
jgi:hypothetical protein